MNIICKLFDHRYSYAEGKDIESPSRNIYARLITYKCERRKCKKEKKHVDIIEDHGKTFSAYPLSIPEYNRLKKNLCRERDRATEKLNRACY